MQFLEIDQRLARRCVGCAEHVDRTFLRLSRPFRDLVWVYIELLRQFGQRPLALFLWKRYRRLRLSGPERSTYPTVRICAATRPDNSYGL
jgi:hypothetical protein